MAQAYAAMTPDPVNNPGGLATSARQERAVAADMRRSVEIRAKQAMSRISGPRGPHDRAQSCGARSTAHGLWAAKRPEMTLRCTSMG